MSLDTLPSPVALIIGVSQVSILQADNWIQVSSPARHYFATCITATGQHQDLVQCAVWTLSE